MNNAELGALVRKIWSHLGLGFAILGWVLIAVKLEDAHWYWKLSPCLRWLIPFPLAALYVLFCILVSFFASGQWRRNPDKKITNDKQKQ